jgi:hypothetical protein
MTESCWTCFLSWIRGSRKAKGMRELKNLDCSISPLKHQGGGGGGGGGGV